MKRTVPALSKELLAGTWLAEDSAGMQYSIYHLENDGRLSWVTLITDGETQGILKGKWSQEGDDLVFKELKIAGSITELTGEESEEERSSVKVLSQDLLEVTPELSPTAHRWKRLRRRASENHSPHYKAPSVEQVKALTVRDLLNYNPLYLWVLSELTPTEWGILDITDDPDCSAALLETLNTKLPRKTALYYCAFRFGKMWGEGGLDAAISSEDPASAQAYLKLVSEAYRTFGNPEVAALITEIAEKLAESEQELANGADEEDDFVWSWLARYDDIYEDISNSSANIYEVITGDLQENPQAYTQ